jgi:hypothetical protein
VEIYSIDNLTLREIQALRQSLDFIQITGVDAMFIGLLQTKLSQQIQQIENHIQENPQTSTKTKRNKKS